MKKTCELFEKEILLYMNNELPEDRIAFWQEHLAGCETCSVLLDEMNEIEEQIAEPRLFDVEDNLYENMINKAVSVKKSSFVTSFIKRIFQPEPDKPVFGFYKLAFGGALVLSALLMLFIFKQPERIKQKQETINSEMLAWDTNQLDKRIEDMGDRIELAQDDNWLKYIYQKYLNDGWNAGVQSLSKKIEELQQELKNESL